MPLMLLWIPREAAGKWRRYAKTFDRSLAEIVAHQVRQMHIRQMPDDWFKHVDPTDLEGLWEQDAGKEAP